MYKNDSKDYRFRDKVADPTKRVVIFEFVPPEVSTALPAITRSAATLVKTLKGFEDVDAVYVPEVVGKENKGVAKRQRVDARQYAAHVRNFDYDNTELIISQGFPYLPREITDTWLEETAREYRIGNVVVVGARHRYPEQPGYNVEEALMRISQLNETGRTKLFPGAIAIDTRGADPHEESQRMVEKTKAGAQFFVTQIFYNPKRMIQLLQNYSDECDRTGIEPRRVFLGVAAIPSKTTLKNTIDKLREPHDLEKEEPEVYERLFSHDSGIGNRSIEIIEETLRRIFDYCYGNEIDVPLGLCIEHVTESNFRHSFELLQSLPALWREYKPDSKIPYTK